MTLDGHGQECPDIRRSLLRPNFLEHAAFLLPDFQSRIPTPDEDETERLQKALRIVRLDSSGSHETFDIDNVNSVLLTLDKYLLIGHVDELWLDGDQVLFDFLHLLVLLVEEVYAYRVYLSLQMMFVTAFDLVFAVIGEFGVVVVSL